MNYENHVALALRLARERNNLPALVQVESPKRPEPDNIRLGNEASESTIKHATKESLTGLCQPETGGNSLGGQFISDEEWEAEIQADAEERDAGLTRYTEAGGIE